MHIHSYVCITIILYELINNLFNELLIYFNLIDKKVLFENRKVEISIIMNLIE